MIAAALQEPLARRKLVRKSSALSCELAEEVALLSDDRILVESGDCAVYEAGAGQIPLVLQELGRLRELTFRAAGEGTGRATDLDKFDETYRHLFIWNRSQRQVIGAYRSIRADRIGRRTPMALYTSTLFEYAPSFFERMGPCIELGRSFVRPEDQRSYAYLLLLWKGIGAFLSRHAECRMLYGAVSISRNYSDASRQLICERLKRRHLQRELAELVRCRQPFNTTRALEEESSRTVADLKDLDDLSSHVSRIEPNGKGIPVLLKHYLRLGAGVIGFNVDPDFSDALDVLTVLDLSRAETHFIRRCMPAQGPAPICC